MEYIVAVVVAMVIMSHPIVKGFIGNILTWITMRGLDKSVYSVFNKVKVTKKDGTIELIDQVIVSKYGVFVFKKKDMSGSIFGNELMDEWSQIKLGRSKKFPNPIIENKGNVKSLAFNLGMSKGKFISIISFSNKGILRKVVTTTPVVLSIWAARGVKSYEKILLNDIVVESVKKQFGEMI